MFSGHECSLTRKPVRVKSNGRKLSISKVTLPYHCDISSENQAVCTLLSHVQRHDPEEVKQRLMVCDRVGTSVKAGNQHLLSSSCTATLW